MPPQIQRNPIEIKISTVVAIAVILHDTDLLVLGSALKKLTANSSDFYSEECAVIDVANIDATIIDWIALIDLFKSAGFHPVAVRHAPEQCEEQIIKLGLRIDLGSKTDEVKVVSEVSVPPSTINSVAGASSLPPMIIDTPVRGGQRVYARGRDLIITAVVNNGAEVIADGNIHIYAPLRGRALAGASGGTQARIFIMSLEAELVSIAGIYRTFENGYPALTAQMPIQISLNGDRIDVLSICSS